MSVGENALGDRKLVSILRIKIGLLREFSHRADSMYRPFSRPKKGGGTRWIDSPLEQLKSVQKTLYDRLLKPVPLPAFVLGGVPGKSVRHNAEPHVGQDMVIGLDIEEYFPSIKVKHVEQALVKNLKTGRRTTRLLSRLVTYKGRLPQGAPTSTALANMVLAPILEEFSHATSEYKLNLTSWVDDITISGTSAALALKEMVRLLKRNGFQIARKKTRLMPANVKQEATKIVVNKKPSIGQERKRLVRSELRAGPAVPTAREKGLITHAQSICGAQGASLRRILDERIA